MNVHATPIGWPALAILFGGLLLFGAMLLFVGKRAPEGDQCGRSRRSIIGIVIQMLAFFSVGAGPLKNTLEPASPIALAEAALVLEFSAITCGLFFASKRALGRNWSLVARTRSDHELVTWGPFAYVRHPIYSALFFWLLGMAVAFGHYRGLILGVPLYWIGTGLRITEEEKLLRAQFGPAYDGYAARVKRFAPGLF